MQGVKNKLQGSEANGKVKEPLRLEVESEKLDEEREDKILEDDDFDKGPNKPIRSSNSYKHSLPNNFETCKPDYEVMSYHQGKRGVREYKQQLTYLKHPSVSGQFIAYCIVNKQSNFGMTKHERLLVVDSNSKEVKYFSEIPQLPLYSLQEISKPKQAVNMANAKKFAISMVKNSIGEVLISWMELTKLKKWNIVMGNNQIARDLCILVDNVKNNKHLQRRGNSKNPQTPTNRVNNNKTHFISEVIKLQEKRSSNRGISHHQSLVSNQQFSQRKEQKLEDQDVILNPIIQERRASIVKQEKIINNQAISKEIKQADLLSLPEINHLDAKQSVKSIKIEQIIKEAEYHSAAPSKNEHQQSQQRQTDVKQQARLSQIDKMLKNRRILDPAEDKSITTIKNLHQEQQPLGMSKLLVKNLFRKQTNKQEIQTSKKEKQKLAPASPRYYHSEKPQNIQNYRQNLLIQRRFTENSYNKEKQRKTYILNQHNHPRQEKSRSRSKDIDSSKSNILVERDWLMKWINAKDNHEKAEIYSKFIDHCKARVQKLTQSFQNWHLFHKQPEEYKIKQNNIEYTYEMLKFNETGEISLLHEQEMLKKMENLNFIWKIINSAKNIKAKIAVPLACIVSYKGLKVFCKVQLASDSLLIQQLQDKNLFSEQLQIIENSTKGTLKYCSLFLITSNQSKWLYINDADICLNLSIGKGYSTDFSYLSEYLKSESLCNFETILQHLNRTIIPSFLNTLNNTQPLTTLDFEQLLKSNHLNSTLLPLIFHKSLQMKTTKATKWIISQICASLLQEEVRLRIHSYLMKKQANKSLSKQIFPIIAKALRWNSDSSALSIRIKREIGVDLKSIQEDVVGQYVISSLLIKLSLACNIKHFPHLITFQEKNFSFWREFEFQDDALQLTFAPCIVNYEHQHFSNHYAKIEEILSTIPSSKMVLSEFQIIEQKLKINKQKDYRISCLYKLLPISLQTKIDHFHKFCKNIDSNATINEVESRFPKSPKLINATYYLSVDCFKFQAQTINQYIKQKQYAFSKSLIQSELIRAWIWSLSRPLILIGLYDLHAQISLQQRLQTDCISSSLKCLQLSLDFYEQNYISITLLMEKIYKAAKIHTIFNDFPEALNHFKASHEIYENMLLQSKSIDQLIIKYMPIYSEHASILLNLGKTEDCIKAVKSNLLLYNKWKQDLKNAKYEVLVKIHSQQFENYLLLIRCYELLSKRLEMIQLIEECSIKFIENYIDIMVEKKKGIDAAYIPEYRFKEIVKNIWYAIILNCSSKNITYQQYFSKVYSNLKLINLVSIRDIILAVHKECEGNHPFQPKVAIQKLSLYIYENMPTTKLEKISSYYMNSIFVESCVNCLKTLSSPKFLEAETSEDEEANSKCLEFLSCLISLMGYDYSLCTFNVFSEEPHFQY